MRKTIRVSRKKCVGCWMCQLACSFAKEGVFNLKKARLEVIWMPETKMNVPIICRHCRKPLCMDACPVGAISRDEGTGAAALNRDLCIDCGDCITACPFGAITKDPGTGNVVMCDLCQGDPECVKYCVYGALQFVGVAEAAHRKRKTIAKQTEDRTLETN